MHDRDDRISQRLHLFYIAMRPRLKADGNIALLGGQCGNGPNTACHLHFMVIPGYSRANSAMAR